MRFPFAVKHNGKLYEAGLEVPIGKEPVKEIEKEDKTASELSKELKEKCKKAHRHVNTQSDSEILLNIFAWKISKIQNDVPTADDIFDAVAGVYDEIKGGYAVVSVVLGVGLIAFRDPFGIRPMVLGERTNEDGKKEYMVASERLSFSC